MPDARLEALLPRLIELSRADKVTWTLLPTEGENTFVHALPGGAGSLVVRRMFSTFQLTLHNANGEQLESVGELQEVADVAKLWRLIDARRKRPADVYTALVADLQVEDPKTP